MQTKSVNWVCTIDGKLVLAFSTWAGSLKDDWFLPSGPKLAFVKRDTGQTNEQQRPFNEWPISELPGEVDSIQTSLKLNF